MYGDVARQEAAPVFVTSIVRQEAARTLRFDLDGRTGRRKTGKERAQEKGRMDFVGRTRTRENGRKKSTTYETLRIFEVVETCKQLPQATGYIHSVCLFLFIRKE